MNKIYLLGDSTCQTNNEDTYPQTGWGQLLNLFVNENYEVVNLAKNGRSTKSFIDEGLFEICKNNLKENDIVIIQFGHNDEKDDVLRHTDPYSTYQENLSYFIDTARNNNATPILISSIYRRTFDENGKLKLNSHGEYPNAMKDLANKKNVLFIDMCQITFDWLTSIGNENSKQYFMNFGPNIYNNYLDGKEDNTHLRYEGALLICQMIVDQLSKTNLKFILKEK